MRIRLIIFCGILLAVCLWLLTRQTEPPKAQAPLTNQPSSVVRRIQPSPGFPQPAPKTGMELYSQMRSNLLSSDRKARLEQFQEEWRTPIEFYGLVIDGSSNPVADAQVNFSCNDLSASGTSYYHTQTDANGLFSINGIEGKLLKVSVDKMGYYSYMPNGSYFYYAGQNQNFVPDSQNPVVFHLRKKGKGVSLIEEKFPPGMRIAQLHRDGTPVELNLFNGTQVPVGSGQLELEFSQDASSGNARTFDWELQLSVSGGGLIPTDEEFPFEAPQNGYQPSVVIDMPATNQDWNDTLNAEYYIQLPNGDYGRFSLYLLAHNGVFIVNSAINPTGSRNLEPAQ